DFCLRHSDRLTGKELGFLIKIETWRGPLPERQQLRLNSSHARLRGRRHDSTGNADQIRHQPRELLTLWPLHDLSEVLAYPEHGCTTGPTCAHRGGREHGKNKLLGSPIGDEGSVCWGGKPGAWTGREKGSGEGQERRELASHIYRDKDGIVRFRKVRNLPGR